MGLHDRLRRAIIGMQLRHESDHFTLRGLQQMASDSTKFFSDQTGSNNACTSAAHPITGLNQIFQTIGGDLTLARLIPDATK